MSAQHYLLHSKLTSDTLENLRTLVELAKSELHTFGRDLPFEDNIWDLSDWVKVKASTHSTRLRFSNWETSLSKGVFEPMREPFCSFAKSYIRLSHANSSSGIIMMDLIGLRALESALNESTGTFDPSMITLDVFSLASQKLLERMKPSSAYGICLQFQKLSKFLCTNRMTKVRVVWRNPLSPNKHKNNHVGKEFDDLRMSKLPSPAAFNAIAQIFNTGTDNEDILVSSVCAILCSAPSRISEVTLLPSECEVTQVDSSTGTLAYGLSWIPSKGGDPMVKYVVGPMHDIVKEALIRLRLLNAPALELVRWYEENPDKLYLSKEIEYLREQPELNINELWSIIFTGTPPPSVRNILHWAKRMHVPIIERNKQKYVRFSDVEAAVVKLLPRGFPFFEKSINLRYSEALMVTRLHELSKTKSTYRCMFRAIDPQDINRRISNMEDGKRSIFSKHGFTEENGDDIHLTTHKFRHYLNTLAQQNFMDQLDLARWSGRRNVSQNSHYDHVSDREVTEKIRLALQGGIEEHGPIARLHRIALVSLRDFIQLRIKTAHTTQFGYCVHDFSMLPCQLYQDCINCSEHACIKGSPRDTDASIRQLRDETVFLLKQAKIAMSDREYGADKWVAHQTLTLRRVESLCEILDDARVPDGAVISLADAQVQTAVCRATQLRPPAMSPFRQIAYKGKGGK